MAKLVSCEQFLLRRTAAEQLRVAESMRRMAQAVGQFVDTVGDACMAAQSELAEAMDRTHSLQRDAADERARSSAALTHGGLDVLIAERDRLLAELQRRGGCADPG